MTLSAAYSDRQLFIPLVCNFNAMVTTDNCPVCVRYTLFSHHLELRPAKDRSTAQQLLPVICSFRHTSLVAGHDIFHFSLAGLRRVIENHDMSASQ